MRISPPHYPATALCLAVLILGACASRPAERFYVLEAAVQAAPSSTPSGDLPVIGVGPIEIPAYLRRPQIMTKVRANELKLNENALWAEPLEDALPRVIALNLAALTGAEVLSDPWHQARRVAYRLSAKLTSLDGAPGGQAMLDASWVLENERGEKGPIERESHLLRSVGQDGFHSLAEAYSILIADFSREVALELTRLPR